MLMHLIDHGEWLATAGINRKALRAILGNPLIAITMLRHDLTAGLFAPVELLILEEDHNRSSLTYVKPSSLMVVDDNPPLRAAALALDEKLAALAAKVVAGKSTTLESASRGSTKAERWPRVAYSAVSLESTSPTTESVGTSTCSPVERSFTPTVPASMSRSPATKARRAPDRSAARIAPLTPRSP